MVDLRTFFRGARQAPALVADMGNFRRLPELAAERVRAQEAGRTVAGSNPHMRVNLRFISNLGRLAALAAPADSAYGGHPFYPVSHA